jgi:hypothetical protein
MTDMDVFEARFARAYQRYLIDAPTQVDAAALAHSAVVTRRLPRLAGWTWPWRSRRVALWAAVALLLALSLGAAFVGSAPTPAPTATPAPSALPTYPVLTGTRGLAGMSRAVSGDELWTVGEGGLWHYADEAWQGPIRPPLLDGETVSSLALAPDGAVWVAGQTTVAVLRDGAWRVVWKTTASRGLAGLDVAPDGTAWVAQGAELIGLQREAAAARSVACPQSIQRIAVATDGTVYAGGYAYGGGEGLASSDGITCALIDPVGDGGVHQIAELAAGPAGSLLATVFDNEGGNNPPNFAVWVVMMRDGRWSTLSGPTDEPRVSFGLAIAPDGQPWRIDSDSNLTRYEDGVWRVVAASAQSLTMAPDGVLWYETDRGIERIRMDQVGQ